MLLYFYSDALIAQVENPKLVVALSEPSSPNRVVPVEFKKGHLFLGSDDMILGRIDAFFEDAVFDSDYTRFLSLSFPSPHVRSLISRCNVVHLCLPLSNWKCLVAGSCSPLLLFSVQ